MAEQKEVTSPVIVFYSYAHEDEHLRRHLEKHLSLLCRRGVITEWHDQKITPGSERIHMVNSYLRTANIILLLISPDFLASDYCYSFEMEQALERHRVGEACVIPIILRSVDWQKAPFGHLQYLPRNAKPVVHWKNRDDAFLEITKGITDAIERFRNDTNTVSYSSSALTTPLSVPKLPTTYIPLPRDPLFQPRYGEFEQLESLLCETGMEQKSICVGLVGMGGIGKTQLAVELAYHLQQQGRFQAGIFWTNATGTNLIEWQHHLAKLAFNTGYLPPDDDIAHLENDARRARYLSRYLAQYTDALLILDNVEEPELIISSLTALAGEEMKCSILYTSRIALAPLGITTYSVQLLSEKTALHLLLEKTRPLLLAKIEQGSLDTEALAAKKVCQLIGYLPLALVHLRGQLALDRHVSLERLAEILIKQGTFDVVKTLFVTFRLSWECVQNEQARHFFKLASCSPEAVPIPLWLLGLASGLGESATIFDPLGRVCTELRRLNLVSVMSGDQVRLHPLVREFGQRLLQEDGDQGYMLLKDVSERLVAEWTNLSRLEDRARREGFWRCLEQSHIAGSYVEQLGIGQVETFRRIEKWLDRESYLLGDKKWWPDTVPGLFYQQLLNRSVEEGIHTIFQGPAPATWIHQCDQVGAEDQTLIRIYIGHTDPVPSVAFSPDGIWIIAGSYDKTARIWDTASGRLLQIFEGHSDIVWSVTFSPDGKQVLTGSDDKTARVWDTASGKQLYVLEGHTDGVTSAVFSPNGKQVLTGSGDKTARIWDTASGRLLQIFEGHSDIVWSVTFSPDGKQVLTGSDDKTARVWDATSGKQLYVLEGHTDGVTSAVFSPNGMYVLTGSDDKTLRLWDTVNRKQLHVLKGHTYPVDSVAFSPNGEQILSGANDGTARLWNTASRKQLHVFEGHSTWVMSVVFSPDGTQILTGSYDKTVRLWEIKSERFAKVFKGHTDNVSSISFSPDGTQILTGSYDKTVRLWDTSCMKPLDIFKGHTHYVEDVKFSPDGTQALTGSLDKTARLWDIRSGDLLQVFKGHTDRVSSVAFLPDGKHVLTASYDNTARLWAIESAEQLRIFKGHTSVVECVAISPNGKQLLTGSRDNTAILWDIKSERILQIFEGHSSVIWSVAFSPDGKQILTSSYDKTVRLWSTKNGNQLWTPPSRIEGVFRSSFSPDGKLLLINADRGQVLFWQKIEANQFELVGLYSATYRAIEIYWQSNAALVLADGGGSRPHLYRLTLEGMKT